MIAVDTDDNILVYAHRVESTWHDRADRTSENWLKDPVHGPSRGRAFTSSLLSPPTRIFQPYPDRIGNRPGRRLVGVALAGNAR